MRKILILLIPLFTLTMVKADDVKVNKKKSTEKKVEKKAKANRLIKETSPYLQQHAYNPVDWYPWGEEALKKAKKENKPIFLSVGYSACHWCHVMEHESFEDENVGKLLNKYFISIKVDREERPDIDDIYMTSVQAMTGSGGWPMSVFLTPEGEPFYGGTYFPKTDRYGKPGFMSVVLQLGEHWLKNEKKIRSRGQEMVKMLKEQLTKSMPETPLPEDILKLSIDDLEEDFDQKEGGFGAAPKFPSSMSLDLYVSYLHHHPEEKDVKKIKEHLQLSLRKMAQGGMYDQIGGGFHRYSTDGQWLVPHFEKMLYDNALLAKTYFEASQLIDKEFNLRIGREICDYVLKEMTHPSGAFFSTTDADSEKMEGKFFLWSNDELEKVLGKEDGKLFATIFDIHAKPIGDASFQGGTPPHDWFHGRIPHLDISLEEQIKTHKLNLEKINVWKDKLWEVRSKRIPPLRDEKVLSSWNGMMSSAMLTAYRISGEEKYFQAAKKNLDFIWKEMQKDGRLKATWKDGDARHFATLEDYANVAAALLELHRIEGGAESLERAKILADSVVKFFAHEKGKAFYYTANDAEALIVRSKNPYDNAVPAGNSVLAGVLVRLGILFDEKEYISWAEGIFKEYSSILTQSPRAFPRQIREYAHLSYGSREIVLLGADRELRKKALSSLRPLDYFLTEKDEQLKLLEGRKSDGEPILFVCLSGVCKLPIVGRAKIEKALSKL